MGNDGHWEIVRSGDLAEVPVVATAVHAGHGVRPEVAELLALGEEERRREEDPGTDLFLPEEVPVRLVGRRSRFEIDLNRPRDGAVYLEPEQAWGLEVWRRRPPDAVVERSLAAHADFYRTMYDLLDGAAAARGGPIALYDVHSYNHRRGGPDAPPDDPDENPEINVGTGGLDRERWAPVVDSFVEAMGAADFLGRRLDVRENVRFQGGHFPRWVAKTFPETVCPLAIEVKKIYMDEWTGELDAEAVAAVRRALASTLPAVARALEEVGERAAAGAEAR